MASPGRNAEQPAIRPGSLERGLMRKSLHFLPAGPEDIYGGASGPTHLRGGRLEQPKYSREEGADIISAFQYQVESFLNAKIQAAEDIDGPATCLEFKFLFPTCLLAPAPMV